MSAPAVASSSKDKEKRQKKSKSKSKAISQTQAFVADDVDDNSATVPDGPKSAYRPPEGSSLLSDYLEFPEFDYDAIKNNDDLELWIVRVPEGMKAKHLKDINISLPTTSETTRLGTFTRKHTSYEFWSVGNEGGEEGLETPVGGDELAGISALVPRKKKDRNLFIAPKPIARHIILTTQPALPTPPPSSPEATSLLNRTNPPRYRHPQSLLKHRFMPYGSLSNDDNNEMDEMEIDKSMAVEKQTNQLAGTVAVSSPVKESPKKKRKVDGDESSHKKSKKAKAK